MSLPKLASSPALSSSPSKQSLRRPTSRPQSINQIAQTNDTPDEYLSPHFATEDISRPAEQDEQAHHVQTSPSHILSQPFFTLIEDTHTSEYYHPTVHYIFSDDDTDIVTEAALRSLESEPDAFPASSTKGKSKGHPNNQPPEIQEGYEDEEHTPQKESLLPEPIPGVRDNYIILDIDHIAPTQAYGEEHGTQHEANPQSTQPENPTSSPNQQHPLHTFTITSAHSLSPTWQVLDTSLLPAPTFGNSSSSSETPNGGLMFQIKGTSGMPMGNLLAKDKERGGQRLEDMMDQFARRLDELRLVIENGERGVEINEQDPRVNPGVEEGVDGRGLAAQDADTGEGEAYLHKDSGTGEL